MLREDEVGQSYRNQAKRIILGLIYQDASASDAPDAAGRFDFDCLGRVVMEDVWGVGGGTGIWCGGLSIFACSVLEVDGALGRCVVLCDSSEGLLAHDVTKYPQDAGYDFSPFKTLAVSLEQVKNNFGVVQPACRTSGVPEGLVQGYVANRRASSRQTPDWH